jgi:flagellin
MSLNVISNFAANVAHRNLTLSDAQATSSVAKLSAGSRVLSAKDDAASLAIGSRLKAEVDGLRQASVNAGQAISLLQIADGAMANVSTILIRMEVLAVQAGSGQLSSVERSMLDTEFQALLAEVDRIAEDTDFVGTQLVNGSLTVAQPAGLTTSDGVASMTARGFDTGGTYSIAYDGTDTFTLTGSDSGGTTIGSMTGAIDSSALSGGVLTTGTTVSLSAGANDEAMVVSLNTAFDAGSAVAAIAITFTGSDTTSFSFKVGTGSDTTADVITVSVDGINATNLGVNSTDVTSTTQADLAASAVSGAIDTLNTARANVGASGSRHRRRDHGVHQQADPGSDGYLDVGPGQPATPEPAAVVPVRGSGNGEGVKPLSTFP